jgi:hypothetical protein
MSFPRCVSTVLLTGLLLLAARREASAEEPAPIPPATEPATSVHVESDRTVSVESRGPAERRWTVSCESPCDSELPLSREYRIVGHGVKRSAAFQLDGLAGSRVAIDVKTGTKLGYYSGAGLLAVGTGGALLGTLIMLAGAMPLSGEQGGDRRREYLLPGAGLTVAGVAGIVGGVLMMTGNRTRVDQSTLPASSSRQPPTWREKGAMEAASPRTTGAPLVSPSF